MFYLTQTGNRTLNVGARFTFVSCSLLPSGRFLRKRPTEPDTEYPSITYIKGIQFFKNHCKHFFIEVT